MKTIDLQGITNMELVRGGIDEWYWSTDYIHGDLYEAEELFRTGGEGEWHTENRGRWQGSLWYGNDAVAIR